MKRLAILLLFDELGIVDEYKYFLMQSLVKQVEQLYVVCNGKLEPNARKRILNITKKLYVRSNEGFDAGAYHDCLSNWIGWEKLNEYDELILLNDTFFGPVYPLNKLFDEMENRDVDYWGITQHQGYNSNQYNCFIPRYIQSYFISFRRSMLCSDEFREYWENLNIEKCSISKKYLILEFSVGLTSFFSERGFHWETYIDAAEYESEYSYNQYEYIGEILLREYKLPFLKKRIFISSHPDVAIVDDTRKIVEHLEKYTDYDTNLIWQSILRTYHLNDLNKSLHFQYMLPKSKNTALEGNTQVLIVEENDTQWLKEIKRTVPEHSIDKLNHGTFSEKILFYIGEFPFLCILSDSLQDFYGASIPGKLSYREMVMDCLLGNVESVKEIFKKEKHIGLISPPYSFHGYAYATLYHKWQSIFSRTQRILDAFNVYVPCNKKEIAFVYGGTAWVRSKSLQWLLSYRHELISLENHMGGEFAETFLLLLPYLVQQGGFHSGTVTSQRVGEILLANYSGVLQEMLGYDSLVTNGKSSFRHLRHRTLQYSIREFCRKYKKLYIYGGGVQARSVAEQLKKIGIDFDGFVVTDGKPKQKELMKKTVFYAKECAISDESVGVILGLDEKYKPEVLTYLEQLGAKNIYAGG